MNGPYKHSIHPFPLFLPPSFLLRFALSLSLSLSLRSWFEGGAGKHRTASDQKAVSWWILSQRDWQ